jgi:hypothetical protein
VSVKLANPAISFGALRNRAVLAMHAGDFPLRKTADVSVSRYAPPAFVRNPMTDR